MHESNGAPLADRYPSVSSPPQIYRSRSANAKAALALVIALVFVIVLLALTG